MKDMMPNVSKVMMVVCVGTLLGCSTTTSNTKQNKLPPLFTSPTPGEKAADRSAFQRAERQFQILRRVPLRFSLKLRPDFRRIMRRFRRYSLLSRRFGMTMAGRRKDSSFSVWAYASLFRVGEILQRCGAVYFRFLKTYQQAGKGGELKAELLRKNGRKLLLSSFEVYTSSLYYAYHQRQILPNDLEHSTVSNPWLKRTEQRQKRLAKMLNLAIATQRQMLRKHLEKQISKIGSGRRQKRMLQHLNEFLKQTFPFE